MLLDIYGFCGNSGLFEYAPYGDLESNLCLEKDPGDGYICLVPTSYSNLERLQKGTWHNCVVGAVRPFLSYHYSVYGLTNDFLFRKTFLLYANIISSNGCSRLVQL